MVISFFCSQSKERRLGARGRWLGASSNIVLKEGMVNLSEKPGIFTVLLATQINLETGSKIGVELF